nr:immunoglobulin heavy chain junction region [Mus musculus]
TVLEALSTMVTSMLWTT